MKPIDQLDAIHWNEALQQEKEAKAKQRIADAEREELRQEMQNEFNDMIGQENVSFSDIEDLVHGYGFDSDEIEDLINNFY